MRFPPLDCTRREEGLAEVTLVILEGYNDGRIIDGRQISQISADMDDACELARATVKTLIIDLQHVRFMSSGMLTELICLWGSARAAQVSIRLEKVSRDMLTVFRLIGFKGKAVEETDGFTLY